MRTNKVSHPIINVHSTPKATKPSFGFLLTKEQGDIYHYLQKRVPRYVKKFNQSMFKNLSNNIDSSDKRDAIMYRALAKGLKLMVKEVSEFKNNAAIYKSQATLYILKAKKLEKKVFIDKHPTIGAIFSSVNSLKTSLASMFFGS